MRTFFGGLIVATGIAVIQTTSLAAGPEIWKAECIYISSQKVKTKAPCTVKVYARATSSTEDWVWDNGTHTTVKMSEKGIIINDQEAEEHDASKITGKKAYCYQMKVSEDIYCWAT